MERNIRRRTGRQHHLRDKKTIRPVAILLAVILFLGCFSTVPAQAAGKGKEKLTVRVGFIPFDGLHLENADGTRTGYGYDVLQMLAPYGNFRYEYVGYDRHWSEKEQMLLDGEIDMMTGVKKTPEREKILDYSSKSVGANYTMLTVRPDNTKYTTEDYSTLEGIRVGLLRGSSRNKSFDEYAKEHHFSYVPVYFDDQEEMSAAMSEEKTIDGIVSTNLRELGNETMLDQFDREDFYVVVKKGNDELMERVNEAITCLNDNTPDWFFRLEDKYQNRSFHGTQLMLTPEETRCMQELAESGKKLKILVNPDLEPYSYFVDGVAKGIMVDLLAAASEKAGFAYEIMQTESSQDYLKTVWEGTADVVFDANFDYDTAEKAGYYLSSPYYLMTYARITRNNDNTRKGVSAMKDSSGLLGDRYLTRFIDDDTIKCSTFDECVEAVRSGKADCTYAYTYTASKYVVMDYTNSLAHEVIKDITCPISIAVREDWGKPLFSVMDKISSNIDSEQRDAAINANTQYNVKGHGFLYLVYNEPVAVVHVILLVTASIVFLVLWFRAREKKAERIHRERDARKNEALQAAYEAANRASHAKSDFLSKMSHDIRTPLNAIIGTVAIAGAHVKEPARVADCLAKITTSSRHLLGLINEVLDMARLESGKMVLSEEGFNLANLIDNLVELVQPGIRAKRHELIVRVHDIRHENVIGDSLRIQQAFVNIVGNATKYTPDGGKIQVEVSELPSKTSKIGVFQFVFKDNGIGMSKEYARTIFDPFSRERDSRVDKIQGTGLGMAITRNIVEMMDGSISVESEQGKGSTFTVIIRLKLQAGEAEHREELAGLPVLVVDDDETICESTCLILDEIGMESAYALSGREAVDMVEERHAKEEDYHAVILDWKMPDMDGLETTKAIRRAVGAEVPIIILTAYDWADIEAEAREAGVNAFVSKPVFKSKLIRTFDEILHQEEAGGEKNGLALMKKMDYSGRHLLLAEDNELNREIAREIIEMTKIQVETAENGEIAVQKFRGSPCGYYSMIFMDVQMPVMNGYDATMTIRSMGRPDAETIPIIALTANAFVEDVEKAMAVRMNEHLAKPLDISRLAEVMNRWMQDGAQAGE